MKEIKNVKTRKMDSKKLCDSCPFFHPVDWDDRFICMCKKENKLVNVESKYMYDDKHNCLTPSWCDKEGDNNEILLG